MAPNQLSRVELVAGRLPVSLVVVLFALVAAAAEAMPRQEAPQRRAASPAPSSAAVLSLDDAIRLAEGKNEQVAIAEAGVERARADEVRARSQLLPQLNASASYDRTLASEFANEFTAPALPPGCGPYTAAPDAPVSERVAAIEQAINCGTIASSLFSGLGSLPFGRTNVYRLNLSFAQALYSGGRISAQRALAASGRQSASVGLSSARAQLVLDVTQAYYDAALSDRFVAIAEAALQQSEATASLVELGYKAGRQPEFEMLRARVARDNQRPLVIQARSQRTLAYLRLRQLLNLPANAPLGVGANLDDPVLPVPDRFATPLAQVRAAAVANDVNGRAPVRQAVQGVSAGEASLRVAKAERWPSVSVNSSYGRVAYPSSLPTFGDFLTNWTVGVAAQVPIFTGGRLRGDEMSAQAGLVEARARLDQARKLAQLDSQSAVETLQSAEAAWQSSAGTVEQAQRAYEIAELRYREGVSTQLELSDARLLLQQAQANRAQAARDAQVARARVALLPDLPLSAGQLPSLSAGGNSSFSTPAPAQGGGGSAGAPNGAATGARAPGGTTTGAAGPIVGGSGVGGR